MLKRVALWAAVVCLTAAAPLAAGDQNPATTPSPRLDKNKQPDPDWMKRHETFVGIARRGNVDVLFMGDSITDAWGGEGHNPNAAGAKLFAERFVPLKAANFGIGGDRTQHVLWRLQNGELDGIKPKAVMLMIGTNNTSQDSAEQIADGVAAIVKTIRQKSPTTKVLLLAIFPRGEKPDNPGRKKIAVINTIISKLDDGKNVRYLDIGAKFTQPDGTLTKDIMPDYLHLSARGYEIWGEAIHPLLQQMLKESRPVAAAPPATRAPATEATIVDEPAPRRGRILGRLLRRR